MIELKAKLDSFEFGKIESERHNLDIIEKLKAENETTKIEIKKLEKVNKHLETEKDEQQELVEFVQIEKEEFAKDNESLKVINCSQFNVIGIVAHIYDQII